MKAKMEYNTASPAVIGVDIGKEVFHLVGLGADGKIAFRRKIRRLGLKDAFEKLPPCIVGMEACLSAHFVSRTLRALGHEPRIIPAIYVKPFVKGQKNDYNDAEANAQRMSGGVYHSGDLAYRDEDGYAYFAGRLGDWMRVDGENLGAAPIERVLLRHPDVVEAAVYGIPAPDVGDQVMAALLLTEGATFDVAAFRAFLAAQPDLGPKQWPSYLRISASLPRTETFKVIKRQLAAQGTDCDDPVWEIPRGR